MTIFLAAYKVSRGVQLDADGHVKPGDPGMFIHAVRVVYEPGEGQEYEMVTLCGRPVAAGADLEDDFLGFEPADCCGQCHALGCLGDAGMAQYIEKREAGRGH